MKARALVVSAAALLAVPAAASARSVYVSVGNGITQYSIAPRGGLLIPLAPFRLGPRNDLTGIAIAPGGRTLYVANSFNTGAIGPDRPDHTVLQFRIDRRTGRLRPLSPAQVTAGTAPGAIALDPSGRFAYVTNTLTDDVSQFAIGSAGQLSALSPATVPAGQSPTDIALSPSGTTAYVANFNSSTLSLYSRDVQGRLAPAAGPPVSAAQPAAIALTPNGRSLYATVLGGVAQFDVDPATGALTPKAPPIVGSGPGPFPVVVSPNGSTAYVGFQNGVTYYAVDPATGKLTRRGSAGVPGVRFPAVGSLAVAGRSLYGTFTGGAKGGVVQYTLDASGRPRPKRPATPTSGFLPNDVAAGPR